MRFNAGNIVTAPNGYYRTRLFGPDWVLVPPGMKGEIVAAYPNGAAVGIRSVWPVYDVNWANGQWYRVEEHLLALA